MVIDHLVVNDHVVVEAAKSNSDRL